MTQKRLPKVGEWFKREDDYYLVKGVQNYRLSIPGAFLMVEHAKRGDKRVWGFQLYEHMDYEIITDPDEIAMLTLSQL